CVGGGGAAGLSGPGKRRVDGPFRVSRDNRDLGVFLLQELCSAAHGTTGACGYHKVSDLSSGLSPNLRAGGAVVDLGIDRIEVLVGENGAGRFPHNLLSLGAVVIRVLGGNGGGRHHHPPTLCLPPPHPLPPPLV